MIWSDIKAEFKGIDTGNNKIRQFAYLVGTVVAALGAILLFRDKTDYLGAILAILGVMLAVMGKVSPAALKPVFLLWMGIGSVLGYFVFRAFLVVMYVVGVVPIGLILRLSGKDPLQLKFKNKKDTYWIPKSDESDPYMPY